MELLGQVQLNTLNQVSPYVPHCRNIRVDKDGTVEILHDGDRKAVLLPLIDN